MSDYPKENLDDYLNDDYYIFGMLCKNCGEVTRYVVSKDLSYTDFSTGKFNFHKEVEFKQCEHCGLITRQELITMTPSPQQIDYYEEVINHLLEKERRNKQ